MPKIVCRTPHSTQVFELTGSQVAGRSSSADLVIDDQTVSRRHARFFSQGHGWYVEDMGSGNGTVLNGVVIRGVTALKDGDELQLGQTDVRFTDSKVSAIRPVAIVESETPSEPVRTLDAAPARGRKALDGALRLQLVADAASAIARTQDQGPLFQIVAERTFEIFDQAKRICIITVDEQTGARQASLALSRSGETEAVAVSRSMLDEVIRFRRGIVSIDAASDERFSTIDSVVGLDLRTVMCAPMVAGEHVLGVIQIDSPVDARPFTNDDLATLLALAAITGMAISHQRINRALAVQQLLAQDLALAKRIQRHFFPERPPSIPGYLFDTEYSSALGVGGDYFDFIRLSDHHHAIVIADVSGKGVSAALYMAKLSSEVRFHAAGKTDAAGILRHVNKGMMPELTDGMFITMLLAVLDTEKGQLQIASAGHMAPLVRHAGGPTASLPVPTNQPLGIPSYGGFEQAVFPLAAGDIVVMFTDGVTEGMNPARALFGEERLRQTVARAASATPSGVRTSILHDLEAFCDGADQNDDITLICFGPAGR